MNTTETDTVGELRKIVCALGVGLLVLSVSVNVFVVKQNRNLGALIESRRGQVKQLETVQRKWVPALNELVQYSQGRPELMAILQKYGISQQTAK